MPCILVTGGAGQLATALAGLADVVVVGRPEFDFDRPETIAAIVPRHRPAVVINAAAWTAVDAAETDPDGARRANAEGPALLAAACHAAGVPLVHISTDYVFDGDKGAPYTEADAPAPTGIYGATKLAGERAVAAAAPRSVIVRTSWVYSATGKNFVRTMLGLAQTRDHLRVVADQRGCPTAAHELAAVVHAIAGRVADWRPEYAGVFHSAGDGETTWHGLAEAAFAASANRGGNVRTVEAITTAEYPTPAKRPADSRLDCSKLERVFGLRQPPWRESLATVVGQLMPRG